MKHRILLDLPAPRRESGRAPLCYGWAVPPLLCGRPSPRAGAPARLADWGRPKGRKTHDL